ncbi:SCO1431 family membrane protein [Streptomyces sp. NPDC004610]|uniref:SCO1431 family membrane protein n=1 Tax=unclassified Streptomyces TaxID=2593676 RepID=UPI0033B7036C
MTAHSTAPGAPAASPRSRARTGGPRTDGPRIAEQVAGWTLVVVIAMLITQLGLV